MFDIITIKERLDIPTCVKHLGGEVPARTGAFRSPFRDDKSPSFSIYGERLDRWKDHATGEGGDCIDLIRIVRGCDPKEAIATAGGWAGLSPTDLKDDSSKFRVPPPPRSKHRPANPDAKPPKPPRLSEDRLADLRYPNGNYYDCPALDAWAGKGGHVWTPSAIDLLGSKNRCLAISPKGNITFLFRSGACKVRFDPLSSHSSRWIAGMANENLWGDLMFDEADTESPVFLTEGESDLITLVSLLQRLQLPGQVLALASASAIPNMGVMFKYFRKRRVFTLLDNDKAGGRSTQRLEEAAKSIPSATFIHLGPLMPAGEDVTSWAAKDMKLCQHFFINAIDNNH
jgi:hypothetical protein